MRRPSMKMRRQRGVAVVTALLLTTLAVSIVASLFWQQQVQVRSMENQRLHLQTKWIQRGALDWASVILRQNYGQRISLDQVWATPLAETRLDQYIERERVEGENFAATLSGQIYDACSRYNLNNLASQGIRDPLQVEVLARLLTNLRLEARLARPIADFVANGQPLAPQEDPSKPVVIPAGRSGTQMPLLRVDDLLAVQGVTPETVERLRPFVIVLPAGGTKVNVNTAPAEVLAAVLPGYSLSEANTLVERRKRAPWNDEAQLRTELKATPEMQEAQFDVRSDYFLVQSRIRLDRAALDAESLVRRGGGIAPMISGGGVSVIWTRQN